MAKPRMFGGTGETKRGVMSPVAWDHLIRQAIQRAEASGDRRAEGLKLACSEGRSEAYLRKLSVISAADLDREFPLPEK